VKLLRAFLLLTFAACISITASAKTAERTVSIPGSGIWEVGSVWHLTIVDVAEKAPREITFEVESETARSCLAGDWKKLKILKSNYKGVSEPAWSLEGNSVSVLIASDICDGYDQVTGVVSKGRFSGRHSQFGISGSTTIGVASAVRIR
jgi:hypothetical protein